MTTFILRSRKGSVQAEDLYKQTGQGAHYEIIAHTLANAFYYSNGMRPNIEVYVVLDSTPDFPKTIRFSSAEGLSLPGFHEAGILEVVEFAFKKGRKVEKNQSLNLANGLQALGFGFDVLCKNLSQQGQLYSLDPKGQDIRSCELAPNPIFILSDHIEMPKNSLKGLERLGAIEISLGKKMLFASQCVSIVHNELDRRVV